MSAADIFGAHASNLWTRYRGEIQITNRIVGGIPKDPDTIKKWIEARLEGATDAALYQVVEETREAMQVEAFKTGKNPSPSDVNAEVARQFVGGNGFKMVDGVLCYESRCLKAALREAANTLFQGVTPFPGRAEKSRKGLKSTINETVVVGPEFLSLGVAAPTIENEQRIKHVTGPRGPQSVITVVDLVEKPLIHFQVDVLRDWMPVPLWAEIWAYIEKNGLGSDRARGDGINELVLWEKMR